MRIQYAIDCGTILLWEIYDLFQLNEFKRTETMKPSKPHASRRMSLLNSPFAQLGTPFTALTER